MRGPDVRRVVTVTVLTGASAAGLVWWNVLGPWHAAAATALACALAVVWSATSTQVADPRWPRVAVEVRPGGRHDVSDLGWAVFGRDGRVTERVVRRVRALAVDRLRAHGVDASDPDARADVERLLGARVVHQLASGEPPRARTVQEWLDAIERLGPAGRPRIPTVTPTDTPIDVPLDTEEHRA